MSDTIDAPVRREVPAITAHALPGILGEIAHLASIEVAVAMAREHGGSKFYFPREIDAGHRLARLLGADAAHAICARYGGETHQLPSAKPFLHWWDARLLRSRGMTHKQIALALGLGQGHVKELLGRMKRGQPQAARDHTISAAEPAVHRACPACHRPF